MMMVISGELRRTEKNLRNIGGTLISTQIKVEETLAALFFVFPSMPPK